MIAAISKNRLVCGPKPAPVSLSPGRLRFGFLPMMIDFVVAGKIGNLGGVGKGRIPERCDRSSFQS